MRTEPILRYFRYLHLPPHLQEISRPFAELAERLGAGVEIPPWQELRPVFQVFFSLKALWQLLSWGTVFPRGIRLHLRTERALWPIRREIKRREWAAQRAKVLKEKEAERKTHALFEKRLKEDLPLLQGISASLRKGEGALSLSTSPVEEGRLSVKEES